MSLTLSTRHDSEMNGLCEIDLRALTSFLISSNLSCPIEPTAWSSMCCLLCCLPQKRKLKDSGSQSNGAGSPKRRRESVLRLTGEDGKDGGRAPTQKRPVEVEQDPDRTIVQFMVGEDEQTDSDGTPGRSPSSNPDNTTITSPSEPSESINTLYLL